MTSASPNVSGAPKSRGAESQTAPSAPLQATAATAPPIVLPRRIQLFDGNGPITSWTRRHLVGKGATGSVYEAVDNVTGGVFCVKEVEFADDFADKPQDMQRFEALRREVELLKEVKHPNVVRFLGVDRVKFIIYIQMEYVYGGNVMDIIRRFGPLSNETACRFTSQLLVGLDYLHDKNIVHRDVKGANILVGVDGVVKLADFGAAKRALDAEEMFKTLAGTPYWMAPEVVRQEGHNKAADVWSLGATVLQMLTGSAPYQHLPPVPALFKIGHSVECPIPETVLTRGNVSPLAIDFMQQCFSRDPMKRPDVKQLMHHPWIRALRAATEASRGAANDGMAGDDDDEDARQLWLDSAILSEQEAVEHDAQIRDFVAYVTERHHALQVEQGAQCADGIRDHVPMEGDEADTASSATTSTATTDGVDDDLADENAEGAEFTEDHSGHAAHEEEITEGSGPLMGPRPSHPTTSVITSSHRLADDEDEDDGVISAPPLATTAVAASVVGASTTGSTGRSAGAALLHAGVDDDVQFDEFDEAHFDRIIAGLGNSAKTTTS